MDIGKKAKRLHIEHPAVPDSLAGLPADLPQEADVDVVATGATSEREVVVQERPWLITMR